MSRPSTIFPGMRFGRLSIIGEHVERNTRGERMYAAKCDCGIVRERIHGGELRAGRVTACGPCSKEAFRAAVSTHGGHRSPAYQSWRQAKARCRNPGSHAWNQYGGRGITFSPKWDDFAAFHADMGPRPAGMTLDRIDNDKGYEPGNCRWATRRDQQNNTRTNRRLTLRGRTATVMEWSRVSGVPYATIRMRLQRSWDAERAVFKALPVKRAS